MDGLRRWFRRSSTGRSRSRYKSRTRRHQKYRVESLEERLLLSAAPAPNPGSVFQQLPDANVQTLAWTDFSAHRAITRSDMLGIFTEIEQNHVVSAAELSSLQILVSNATTVNMPSYVANLTGKIVNGDPANVFVASAASPNGNLFAGCPASQLASLAADWFEGFNPVSSGNPAASMTWTNGVLFGKGGPSFADIYQGQLGDCTLLASLAEVAARRPGVIQNMFIANSDGTFTVRFYHNGGAGYYVDGQYAIARWRAVVRSRE